MSLTVDKIVRMARVSAFFALPTLSFFLAGCGGGSGSDASIPPPAAVAPSISAQPVSLSVSVGATATFSVSATGTAPLSYQWQRNGAAINGATAATYTTAATTSADNDASFVVTVSNTVGSVVSQSALLTVTSPAASSGTDVLTYKYDVMRTGQNLTESALTRANVNAATFGKLSNLAVDGKVDAQPLFLSNLSVGGQNHDVVFIETEHASAYAFDASSGALLWQVSLLGAGETPSDTHNCGQITPEIGITATPVIDRHAGAHGTIYVVAMSKDASGSYHQRLHALDITTGADVGPVEIEATFGATSFAPGQYVERAALLLSNNTIYTTWTSHCDEGPYGGWIIAFNESTRAAQGALNVAQGASGSGFASQGPAIWMSGGGPAADVAGNVYLLTANGRFESTLNSLGFPSGGDYGNSFLKLSSSANTLSVADYFTMSGEISESTNDQDLGSGGILLLPDLNDSGGTVRHLAVGAGKDGNLYVVNRDDLGKFSSVGNNIWQELTQVLAGGIWSTPAYSNSNVYYGPQGGSLESFSITNARLSSAPTSQTKTQFAYPGTSPVVSANGSSNAIVWAYENSSPAVLHAYAADNLAVELYNSSQAANGRDQFGAGNKFIVPVVVDGKVFVATPNGVAVFGLLH